ncbi:MAG: ribonuclease P protein component [Chloroflexi bacterium]|nr:ribonuclease P protein component [Chloroflexota bacterium]MQC48230.1 ribonuclease P protein component [Chloroflexota bacterium]
MPLGEHPALRDWRGGDVSYRTDPTAPLPPERLRASADFSRVMRGGRRSRHALLHCVAWRTGADVSRIGFAVGKQVGGAVVRNRVKRRLRMIVRELAWRPGFDVVIVARPAASSVTHGELRGAVQEQAGRLRLLYTEDR